jgi:DNA-binding CsgD family transcriptional regulator
VALTGALLLERERELARLGQLVDATVDGAFGFVVVEGPAGAGKSSLLEVLAGDAVESGVRVLRATGLELEREYPFGVVRQLFEPALHALSAQDREEVFSGVAELAGELLTGRDSSSGPKLADAGFALAHSFYWSVVGLSDLGPLALVVDDIQWADVPSLRFLAFLLKRSEGLPLLVALARRLVAGGEEPDALAAVLSGSASVIQPAPLSGEAIGVLLAGAAGRDLEADAVLEAERLTGGNPLFVRELADSLSPAGGEAVGDLREALRGAAPAAIGRRVQTALARAHGDAQAIARATAILGDEVPLQRAAALAAVQLPAASVAADELASWGILAVGEPLRFRHPLVREAVLDSIGERERALAHAGAARLVIAAGDPPQRAAVHLLESDPVGDTEAVQVLRSAAHNAFVDGTPELAISALRRALREPPDRIEHPLVLKELAVVEAQVGKSEAALGHFDEAFATAGSLESLTDAAAYYAVLLINRLRFVEAEALIDRVVATIDDPEQRLMLEAEIYGWSYGVPAAGERLMRLTQGMTGDTPAKRLLLGFRAAEAAKSGAVTAADAAQVVSAALDKGHLLAEFGPHSPIYLRMFVELAHLQEPDDEFDRELARAVSEARRHSAWVCLSIASTFRGASASKRGQLLTAEAEARTGLEILAQTGYLAGNPAPLVVLVDTLNSTGDFGEAERLLEVHGFAGPLSDGPLIAELLAVRGRLRLSQGRVEEALADLEGSRARLRQAGGAGAISQLDAARGLVPLLMQTGREAEAREMASEVSSAARAQAQPRQLAETLRLLALAHTDGPDIHHLQKAAATWEEIDAPLGLARTLVDLGAALRRQRQPTAAREPLRRALDLARACGARPLAERAEHELRAAGARPRRDRITGRDALTGSELRVVHLAIEGMTNRQIAETLFVTRKTVESHLDHAFHKLGVHARGELQRALGDTGELS